MSDHHLGGNFATIGKAAIRLDNDQGGLILQGASNPITLSPANPIRTPSTWRG